MKNRMTTGTTLTAAVLSVLLMLGACGKSGTDSPDSGENDPSMPAVDADGMLIPDIPAGTDFGGYVFRLYGCDNNYSAVNDYDHEKESGDVMCDAVYRRNRKVEQLLNIKIRAEKKGTKIGDDVVNLTMSGDDFADLIFTPGFEYPTVMLSGCFAELNSTLELDFSQPWYDHNYVDSLSIDGKLYGINCDITMQHYNETAVVLYNKTIAAQYNMEDFYDIVQKGKWTFDTFDTCARTAARDLDGNGVLDGDDIYGNAGNNGMSYMFYIGAGGLFLDENAGDITIPFGDEENIARMQKVIERFSLNNYTHNDHAPGTQETRSYVLFQNDQALFLPYGLGVTHRLRDMTSDFGILPLPKQDEAQSRYYNNVNYYENVQMSIPKTLENPKRTALVTDVLAAVSRETLRPAYYDIVLKEKYARDAESVNMLNLIFDNRVYDIGIMYSIGNLCNTYCSLFTQKNTAVASTYESKASQTEEAIEKLISEFNRMAES